MRLAEAHASMEALELADITVFLTVFFGERVRLGKYGSRWTVARAPE